MDDITSKDLCKRQKQLADSLSGTNATTTKNGKTIYLPQTIKDFEQIAFWKAEGFTNDEVLAKLELPEWRSRTEVFRGRTFCEECQQMVRAEQCHQCGQPLPRLQPLMIELLPVKCEPREALKSLAGELVKTKIAPHLIIAFMHHLNTTFREQALLLEDVDMIFGEAVTIEIARRRGAA